MQNASQPKKFLIRVKINAVSVFCFSLPVTCIAKDECFIDTTQILSRYPIYERLYILVCAAGRVPPAKRSINPGAAPVERPRMSFLFAAALTCAALAIAIGPALRILAPALARRP